MVNIKIPLLCAHAQSSFTPFDIFPDCIQHKPSVTHELLWVLRAVTKGQVSLQEVMKAVA